MKIFIGNMSSEINEDDLRSAFEKYGTVDEIEIVKDYDTHQSTGNGFVKMRSKEAGKAAIEALDGKAFKGQVISVHQAHTKLDTHGGKPEHGKQNIHPGMGGHGIETGRSNVRGDR